MLNTLDSLQGQASKNNTAKLDMVMAAVRDWRSNETSVRLSACFCRGFTSPLIKKGKVEVMDDAFWGVVCVRITSITHSPETIYGKDTDPTLRNW